MFVRAIRFLEEWKGKSNPEKLPVIVLQNWDSCTDSDFSVFKSSSSSDEELNRISLALCIENPSKFNSFGLLPLDDKFLERISPIKDLQMNKFGIYHGNIKDATYGDFKLCVDYTFSNINSIKNYSFNDLAKLVKSLSPESFTKYINCLSKDEKDGMKRANKIKSLFFKLRPEECPKYLR